MIRRILVVALLAPALAGAQEPPKVKPEWSGTAGLGAIVLTGNTSTTTLNALLSTQRETAGWILGAKASGVYGRTRPVDRSLPDQTVALAASGQLRGDRKLLPQLTVFALGGVDTDHVASVEARGYGEGGLGYIWLDRKQDGKEAVFLRTDLGLRYTYESRWQYYATATAPAGDLPDREQLAPRAGLAARYAFSQYVALLEEAEVLAAVTGGERYQVRSLTKLTSKLTSAMTAGVGYLVAYDSAPAPGKVDTDTALTATLEVSF